MDMSIRARWAGLVAVAGLVACNSSDPVDRYCAQLFACDCQPPMYSSAEVCAAELRRDAEHGRTVVAGTDLVHDERCVAEAAESLAAQSCKSAAEVASQPPTCSVCAPIHGAREIGAACDEDALLGYSDCDQHLACVAGICRDPCARIEEGQDCLDMSGNSLGACEEGLICGFTTRRCMAPVGEGEACPTYTECGVGLLCVNGSCEAPAAVGESCAQKFACVAGAYCDPRDGACHVRAELGERCVDPAGCAAGGFCNSAGVCAGLPAAVCAGS